MDNTIINIGCSIVIGILYGPLYKTIKVIYELVLRD